MQNKSADNKIHVHTLFFFIVLFNDEINAKWSEHTDLQYNKET